MDNDVLVGENEDEERIEFSRKGNIFERYLSKKLTWTVTLLSFPFAAALCVMQIMLMITFIPKAKYLYEVQFECSGIGIIAAVVYLVGAVITIKSLNKPSYCRIWVTIISHVISLGLNIGLIVFAIASPMNEIRYAKYRIDQLLYCNCVDGDGNIQRNGTYPDAWECRSNKPLTCVSVDQQTADLDSKWKEPLLWIMIGVAGFQCLWSLIHCSISVRALIGVWDIFDMVPVPRKLRAESPKENVYAKWFPTKVIPILGWIQLGLAMFSMLLAMCIRGREGWDLFQFCAVGSFVVLNLMSTTEPDLTYCRLSGLGVLHFLCFGAMIGCLSALGEAALYPFAAIELILSGIIVIISFRPIFKVGKLVTEVQG